jgi:hypothetical protein
MILSWSTALDDRDTRDLREDEPMATPPESTKSSLHQRLNAHAAQHWPQIRQFQIRHRAGFAYVDAELTDGTVERLFRLRYTGSATIWGFAIYLYSKDISMPVPPCASGQPSYTCHRDST